MKQAVRIVLTLSLLSVLGLSYQNCTSYSENTLHGSSNCLDCDGGLFFPGVRPPSLPWVYNNFTAPSSGAGVSYRLGFLEISGECFLPDHVDHELRLTALNDVSGLSLGLALSGAQPIYEIGGIKCQQGKYYVITFPIQPIGQDYLARYTFRLKLYHRVNGVLVEDSEFSVFAAMDIAQSLPN